MLLLIYSLRWDIYHAQRARSLTRASLLITSSHLAIIVRENSAPSWKWRDSRLWLYLNSLGKDAISTFHGVNLMAPLGLLSRFNKSLLSHVLSALVETKKVLLSLVRTFVRDHHWRNWDEIVLLNEFFRIDKLEGFLSLAKIIVNDAWGLTFFSLSLRWKRIANYLLALTSIYWILLHFRGVVRRLRVERVLSSFLDCIKLFPIMH